MFDAIYTSFTHLNAFQRTILLVVLPCLLIWFSWYLWTLLNGPQIKTLTKSASAIPSRFQRAYSRLEQLGDQPQLETARLNFLRLLPHHELRDLILLGLSTIGYIVNMDEEPGLYERIEADPSAPDSDLIISIDDHHQAPAYKGRLMHPLDQALSKLNPKIEMGVVMTVNQTPVMLSIQTEEATYSRIGLSRLAEACQFENQLGLLIYLGQTISQVPPPPTVVLLNGPEILSILDGIAVEVD